MKRPAVFFDRDNTLIVSDGFLADPSKVVLVEGAADAVARVRSLGYAAVVFSNQSGVARGMYREEDVHRVNSRLDELLADQNPAAVIDRHEFCPYHPEGSVQQFAKDSDLRKPKPGMILQAAEKLALDLSRSWVIGDAPRDIESGKAAGCKTIWYKDPRLPPSMAARELMLTVPDAVVSSLKEAVDVIAREALMRHSAPPAPPAEPAPQPPRPQPPAISRSQAPVEPENSAQSEPQQQEEETAEEIEGSAAPRREPREPGPRSVATARPLMQVLAQKRAAAQTQAQSPPQDPPAAPVSAASTARLEELAEQILQELQRRDQAVEPEFSISKLLAGIVQIIAIALLFVAWFMSSNQYQGELFLLTAIFVQTLTIALLIMGRQR